MSIEKTMANISNMTPQQRDSLRVNVMDKLAGPDSKWIKDAQALMTALDEFDASQKREHSATETKRIADLEGKPATDRIACAFEFDPPSDTERKLLRVLLDNPGGTCAELSLKIGWDPVAWDMAFGIMCSRRFQYLWPLEPIVRQERKRFIRFLTVEQRGNDELIRYTMKPEAVAAFARLGL